MAGGVGSGLLGLYYQRYSLRGAVGALWGLASQALLNARASRIQKMRKYRQYGTGNSVDENNWKK